MTSRAGHAGSLFSIAWTDDQIMRFVYGERCVGFLGEEGVEEERSLMGFAKPV